MPAIYDSPVFVDPRMYVARTVADMRLIQGQTPLPTSALKSALQSYPICILLGGAAAFDGIIDGVFAWDETSTTADNNSTVIRPTAIGAGNPGRWRSIA